MGGKMPKVQKKATQEGLKAGSKHRKPKAPPKPVPAKTGKK